MSHKKGREIRKKIEAAKPKVLLNRAEREEVQKNLRKTLEDVEKGLEVAALDTISYMRHIDPEALQRKKAKLTEAQEKIYLEAERILYDARQDITSSGLPMNPQLTSALLSGIGYDIAKKNESMKKLNAMEEKILVVPYAFMGEKINLYVAGKNIEIVDHMMQQLEKKDDVKSKQRLTQYKIHQPLSKKEAEYVVGRYKEIVNIEGKMIKRARGMIIAEATGNKKGAEKLLKQINKLSEEKSKIGQDLENMHLKRGKYTGKESA